MSLPGLRANGRGSKGYGLLYPRRSARRPRYYPEDMVTDLPERFIAAEMIREQVLRQTREEVPYGVAVTVESFAEKPERIWS